MHHGGNDGLANSAPDTVSISTGNTAPIANAGVPQSAFVGETVTLDGSGSSDADGDMFTYAWSLLSVPTGSTATLTGANTATPSFTLDVAGTYVAQLVVNDGTVNSTPDSVDVSTTNSAPVADAGATQSALVGTMMTLDGSSSSDADDDPITYAWFLLSTPAGSTATLAGADTATPSFTMDVAGNYVTQLVVNDGTVDSMPDTVTSRATEPSSGGGGGGGGGGCFLQALYL